MNHQDLINRLRKRAEIRLQISTRKSVQENQPDRLAELLLEAAAALQPKHNNCYLCGSITTHCFMSNCPHK